MARQLRDRLLPEHSDDELFCAAVRAEEAGDRDEAMVLFRALMRRENSPARGHFSVGRLLLERGDETGIAMIESVMHAVPGTGKFGCELIIRFLLEADRIPEARPYIDTYRRMLASELQDGGNERPLPGRKV